MHRQRACTSKSRLLPYDLSTGAEAYFSLLPTDVDRSEGPPDDTDTRLRFGCVAPEADQGGMDDGLVEVLVIV